MDTNNLIHRYLIGDLSAAETQKLDRRLANDPDLRREFVLAATTDAGLRDVAFQRDAEPSPAVQTNQRALTSKPLLTAVLAVLAASILAAVTFGSQSFTRRSIATLVSSENAAWESSLPTTPGSKLAPGSLKLIAGIATIRFRSGAEIVMEAPADLELISPLRGKLFGGAAVVSVPEPAIGFVLETPDGYVVDHGTQFAVSVRSEGESDFEVIEGEISVHLTSTGEEAKLSDRQSATISQRILTTFEGLLPEKALKESAPLTRVGTNGRSDTVIRHNRRKKRIRADMLMAKQGGAGGNWDLRSFFSFDVTDVDLDSVKSVQLRLNLVPSGIGFATRLPMLNRFAIYGMTNEQKDNWQLESLWEDAPSPKDGVLLGTFDIPRSQQRGSFVIATEELIQFLRSNKNRPATFVIVRETGQIAGDGPGLVHAFASDAHPEASGPILEFSLR